MTTKPGFRVAIKAFLPCGTTAAELIAAKNTLARIDDLFFAHGFVDFRLDDRFVANHRIASSDPDSGDSTAGPSDDTTAAGQGRDAARQPGWPLLDARAGQADGEADRTAPYSASQPAAAEPSADPLALPPGLGRRVPRFDGDGR